VKLTLAQPVELLELAAAEPSDVPRRMLQGLAVPWDVDAIASTGPVRFLPGSLPTDGPPPKLIRDHDRTQPIGLVVERVDTPDGMMFSARISDTADGREALTLAADGVLDAVSVGVELEEWTVENGVTVVSSGRWMELSLVPWGAFPDARIHDVAAQAAEAADPEPDPAPEPVEPDPEPDTDPAVEENPMTENAAPSPLIAASRPPVRAEQYLADVLAGRHVEAATMDTGDTPGMLPVPITGPLYDGLRADRPLISAVGVRALPNGAGKSFVIPKVTQRPTVGTQAAEHDVLSSQALIVDDINVSRITCGGYVDISEQDLDWTDPAALAIVLEQLGRAYARHTEDVACTTLEGGVGSTDPITSWTDADEVLRAVYTASETIYTASGDRATHLFLAVDRFTDLAMLQSTAGDFLFPPVGPASAFGSLAANAVTGDAARLTIVVSPMFTAGTFIVGNPAGLRLFEQQKGAVRVEQPSTLSVQLAWRGYFASTVLDSAMFVGLVDAP